MSRDQTVEFTGTANGASVRALHIAAAAIDREMRKQDRSSGLPSNAGKPWTAKHDQDLGDLFDSGGTTADIAKSFRRTRGSIASRLVRLGKVPDRQSAFVANLHHQNKNGENRGPKPLKPLINASSAIPSDYTENCSSYCSTGENEANIGFAKACK